LLRIRKRIGNILSIKSFPGLTAGGTKDNGCHLLDDFMFLAGRFFLVSPMNLLPHEKRSILQRSNFCRLSKTPPAKVFPVPGEKEKNAI
jgi:hypothetical protein